jgi:MFS transporter, SET family, sugar efflux transporter
LAQKFPILAHPTLRLIAAAMFLLGAQNASIYPYQSLIAIERIGVSKPAFAMIMVLASITAVSASVLFGILGDQRGNRRRIALATTLASACGTALMWAAPSPAALILCHGILLPVASSLFGQLFALARLASPADSGARDKIMLTIRAMMSVSFLGMLIFWTYAFGVGADVMAIYISAGLASAAMVLLIGTTWPKDGATPWRDNPSGLNFKQAMAEITRPFVLLRLLFLGAVNSAGVLYMVLVSLVFEAAPLRGTSDVALFVGLIAGWEVPCLLLLPRLTARFSRSALIAAGTLIYAVHLVALPTLANTPYIWAMTMVAGLGGTAMISLPIAYYQDLLLGRPGTAGAMLALQKLVADILAAAAFAFGTAIGGYQTAASLGASLAIFGAVGLCLADRHRQQSTTPSP